jgi:hypothetical protein
VNGEWSIAYNGAAISQKPFYGEAAWVSQL